MNKINFDFQKLFNIKKFHTAYLSTIAKENGVGVGCLVFLKAMTLYDFHSQQELSEFIGCNKAHTSRIVSSMQKKGLINLPQQKTQNTTITLTQQGMQLAKKVEKIDKTYKEKLLVNINDEDLDVFKKVCKQIYENSENLSNS